ncbi:MAG TPA: glycosyltransferase family 87 protein [Candidatus Polarisedimenticolaceae bacterium]|nr:glycosyltransferase family 87 protein [Candidatus Polarisedimenticolaceae bacterium]
MAQGEGGSLYAAGGGPADGTPQVLAAHEFKNLPLLAWAFAPFATLPYLEAKRAFWWLSLACLIAGGAVAGAGVLPRRAGTGAERALAGAALALACDPAHVALRHGQTTPLILLLLAGAWAAAQHAAPRAEGALLALAATVKIPVLALVALAGLRARWRTLLACALVAGAFVSLSFLLFGAAPHRAYLAGLAEHAGTVMPGHNNQSVAAVAQRLLSDAPVNDWTPRPLSPPVRRASLVGTLLLAAAFVWGAVAKRRSPEDDGLDRAGALSLGLLALPVAWDHYFLLLVPAIVAVVAAFAVRGLLARPLVSAALFLSVLAITLPTPERVLQVATSLGPAAGLLLSHQAMGTALLLLLAAAARRAA